MREQLIGDGEEAFYIPLQHRGLGGEKIRYRVAVGPISDTLAKEKRILYPDIWG